MSMLRSRSVAALISLIGHWTALGTASPFAFGIRYVIESWLFERKNIVKTAELMERPLSEHESR
jgi:hypothetical protein